MYSSYPQSQYNQSSYQQSYGYSYAPQQSSYAYTPFQCCNNQAQQIPTAPVISAIKTPRLKTQRHKKSWEPAVSVSPQPTETESFYIQSQPESRLKTNTAAPCGQRQESCSESGPISAFRSIVQTASTAPRGERQEPCSGQGSLPPYVSRVEESIRSSTQPIPANQVDIIEINGIRGIWLNKAEVESWRGEIPLSEYAINNDSNPELVKLRYSGCIERVQELAIKYLKPPKPPTPGPLIIKQEANIPTGPAPPIIIRQIPEEPCNPPPVVIREKPPVPPEPICPKTITIPGERLPPPPRRVVIEKLAPAPVNAQSVTVERWLPYDKRERKVILEKKPCDPCVEKPKNVVFEWEPQCVNPRTDFKDLGVEAADPEAYVRQHGSSLKTSNELPPFALEARPPAPLDGVKEVELVGDLDGLRLVNLDKEGLSQYRKYVR